jgi:hypothetical protein
MSFYGGAVSIRKQGAFGGKSRRDFRSLDISAFDRSWPDGN